jgi:hypothetical protein
MPKTLDDPRRCNTCSHWQQIYEQNERLGKCLKIGIIVYGKKVSICASSSDAEPTSDFEVVRTLESFGCCKHSDFVMNQYS